MGQFKTKWGDLIFSIICMLITLIFIFIFYNSILIKNYEGLLSAIGIIIFGYVSFLYFKSFIIRLNNN